MTLSESIKHCIAWIPGYLFSICDVANDFALQSTEFYVFMGKNIHEKERKRRNW